VELANCGLAEGRLSPKRGMPIDTRRARSRSDGWRRFVQTYRLERCPNVEEHRSHGNDAPGLETAEEAASPEGYDEDGLGCELVGVDTDADGAEAAGGGTWMGTSPSCVCAWSAALAGANTTPRGLGVRERRTPDPGSAAAFGAPAGGPSLPFECDA
jgi:hypothetical protein